MQSYTYCISVRRASYCCELADFDTGYCFMNNKIKQQQNTVLIILLKLKIYVPQLFHLNMLDTLIMLPCLFLFPVWQYLQTCLFLFPVWQYLLLQLCVASTLLLPWFPRESVAIQAAAEEPEEGVAAHMSCRPVLQHCHTEEKSGHHCTKEIYYQIEKREW